MRAIEAPRVACESRGVEGRRIVAVEDSFRIGILLVEFEPLEIAKSGGNQDRIAVR